MTNITKQKQTNENQSSCLDNQFLLIWTFLILSMVQNNKQEKGTHES